MKKRSLLLGLGLLVTLSMAVPVLAAEEQPVIAEEQQKEDENHTFEWKHTDGKFFLTDTEGEKKSGIFRDEKGMYYLHGESAEEEPGLVSGKVIFSEDQKVYDLKGEETGTLAAGTYWFSYDENADGEEPDNAGLVKSDWKKDGESWLHFDAEGKQEKTADNAGAQQIQDGYYYLDSDGRPQTGEFETDGVTYAYDGKGGRQEVPKKESGWNQEDGKWIFYKEDGTRDTEKVGRQEVEEGKVYFLDADGTPLTGCQNVDGKVYYFDAAAGTEKEVAGDGWVKEDGKWFYFEDGKAVTGWKAIKGKWYYMTPETGEMKTGFFKDAKDNLYYSDNNGAMAGAGWNKIDSKWYWMENSGAVSTGWKAIKGKWYYMTPETGEMKTGWYQVNGKYYFSDKDGAMKTGWLKQGNTWYYLKGSGEMATGWQKLGSTWYYLDPNSGAMKTGWYKIGDTWYYSSGSGAMASNQWVGNYYLKASGAMAVSQWIGEYYVGADGKWIPGGGNWEKVDGKWYFKLVDGTYMKNRWKKISGKWYYFQADGQMTTGWKYIGNYKYYFNSNGAMVQDLDGVIGKQSSYYITVNRRTCQVMVYARDGAKGYTIPVKTFACSVGMPNTPTPTGTFHTQAKYRWHTLMGPSYGQYCTRIVGGVLFHSVAGSNMTSHNLNPAEYNKLGSPASHGCVRLCVRDARWIYDHCALGTTVMINDTVGAPFDKPASIKIAGWQNWDPTDPNA